MNAKRNICWVSALTLLMGVGLCNASLLAHFSFDSDVNSVAGSFTGTGGLRDDAHIDNSVYKLGGGSLKLDGGYGAGETNGTADVDGVYYSNDSEMNPGTGSYTVAFWINQIDRTNPSRQTLIDGGSSTFQLFMNANRWGTYINDSGTAATYTGTYTPPPGTWKHIAIVIDQTANTMVSYENGVVYGSPVAFDSNIVTLNGNNFNIGYQLVPGANRGINGYIDEMGVWNEALSASQINDVYLNGVEAVPEPATIGLFGMAAGLVLLFRRCARS